MEFGVSFSPTNKDGQQQEPGQQGPSATPIQDAIQLLTLRIPNFRGPGIAPMPLLQGMGSQGVMPGAPMKPGMPRRGAPVPGGLQQLLAQMFGAGQSSPTGGAPVPNVKVGVQAPAPSTLQPIEPPTEAPTSGLRTTLRDKYADTGYQPPTQ